MLNDEQIRALNDQTISKSIMKEVHSKTLLKECHIKKLSELFEARVGADKRLKAFLDELEENRIKRNTDFALVRKYDQTRIFCHEVWLDTIKSRAQKHNIEITEYFTYSFDRNQTELLNALKKYGRHLGSCKAFPATSDEQIARNCDCGLEAALTLTPTSITS